MKFKVLNIRDAEEAALLLVAARRESAVLRADSEEDVPFRGEIYKKASFSMYWVCEHLTQYLDGWERSNPLQIELEETQIMALTFSVFKLCRMLELKFPQCIEDLFDE